ncbi:7-methylxanthosine synthase 1 [Ananas comosus]|uniref:7-methylxanthosine synthase 1 n=1 Tax=Ananas comosus TaxID=4615 RepID=A0A199USV2_ANACO|nr:7-methylxanthosine synthase 1 [Ananas comosus]
MEVQSVLHMNSGVDDMSYAKNSTIQKIILDSTNTARQEAAVSSFRATGFPTQMTIADLGCSVGPNALFMVSEIVEAIAQASRQLNHRPPEIQVFLNDLPGNDFNTMFDLLPEFYRLREVNLQESEQQKVHCFISVVAGSFYGRLFLSKSLHFVYSSSSLHWLSQGLLLVPPVPGGRGGGGWPHGVDIHGEEKLPSLTPNGLLHGLIEEEKVESFNAPYYAPSMEEVKDEVTIQGSFSIRKIELLEVNWDDNSQEAPQDGHNSNPTQMKNGTIPHQVAKSAQTMAKGNRAVVESMLRSHFGEAIIEELFKRYCFLLEQFYSKNKAEMTNILIVLVRN